MNSNDMKRMDGIIAECAVTQIRGFISPYKGKYLVSFCGHMDEFENQSDACKWLAALFLKMASRVLDRLNPPESK